MPRLLHHISVRYRGEWINKLGKRVSKTVVGNIWHDVALAFGHGIVRYHKR